MTNVNLAITIVKAAGAGAAVAFLQTAEALGLPHWSEEIWWPIVAATATAGISILQRAEKALAEMAAKQ